MPFISLGHRALQTRVHLYYTLCKLSFEWRRHTPVHKTHAPFWNVRLHLIVKAPVDPRFATMVDTTIIRKPLVQQINEFCPISSHYWLTETLWKFWHIKMLRNYIFFKINFKIYSILQCLEEASVSVVSKRWFQSSFFNLKGVGDD